MTKICVIGGGPAGVMAAFAAAGEDREVTLIERNESILKKLLLTGNGKCNYSNKFLDEGAYSFDNNHPFADVIKEYDSAWLEKLFKSYGMLTYVKDGLKYPRCEKADTVRDTLLSMLDEKNIKIICQKKVVSAEKKDESNGAKVYNNRCTGLFELTFEDGSRTECDRLILTTGGKAYPSTGSDGAGYKIARGFGHTVTYTYPVLTRLFTEDKEVTKLAGIRYKARVSAFVDEEFKGLEEGEIQFTDKGLSGICIFNLSRFLSKPLEEKKKCEIIIDFLPEMNPEDLFIYLEGLIKKEQSLDKVLQTMFGEKIAHLFMKRAGVKESVLSEELCKTIKNFKIQIYEHDSFSAAQLTKGGVVTDEIDGNMESLICPGLFFAGEVLDVDAKCGGYNLHWAFASGFKAGTMASNAVR